MTNRIDNITVKTDGFQLNNPKDNQAVPLLVKYTVLYPYVMMPFMAESESEIAAVKQAMSEKDRLLAIVSEVSPEDASISNNDFNVDIERFEFKNNSYSKVGVLGRIVKMLTFPDGSLRILVRGVRRIKINAISSNDNQTRITYSEFAPIKDSDTIETAAMMRTAVNQFQEIAGFLPNFPDELKIAVMNGGNGERTVDLIADSLNLTFAEKLGILSLPTLQERLQFLLVLLNREVEIIKLGAKIQSQVHMEMSRSQREYFLNEQLKTIQAELGRDNRNPDLIELSKRIESLTLPEKVTETIAKEMSRLELIPQASPEYHVSYNYIDWLLSVPWYNCTEELLDVKRAKEILDHDHYGLTDVKERILEYLAVLQLRKDRKAPILCLVGPPGVGKTSLGQSIARAMNRKFIRVALGGVRDEAEIRGHRRTYIGAMPGRILQNLKKCQVANPVFMLDEIDKLGNDQRGDPSSALLEVLDPAQNKAFNDHYLELDYDLSRVFFIATANMLDSIPQPLQDRMEIIHLSGYTTLEKKQIAKRYLLPRQCTENGLLSKQISFSLAAIDEIINFYTREAGVRQLERTIGAVLRKLSRKIVEGEIDPQTRTKVSVKMVQEFLGPRKFMPDEADINSQIGCANGMAWTSCGGTTLPIETTLMNGKGALKLTGSLGNVMKESAETAFSFLRSHAHSFGIDESVFEKKDFHIHVPDGATPKDGPSAGITLTMALLSLLWNKPLVSALAMTGEVTLRGRVTAIGGVKEKVIAALRSGIKKIILPLENEKDMVEVPEEVKSKVTFYFVKNVDEAIKIAFENKEN